MPLVRPPQRCAQATVGQDSSPGIAGRQLHPAAGRRRTHFRRLCPPRAPASVPRTWAGLDGRAGSTALRSAAREPTACAAGLMHSTRAHGAGIAAISDGEGGSTRRRRWKRCFLRLLRGLAGTKCTGNAIVMVQKGETTSLRLSGLGFCFCEVVLKRTCSLPNPCADHHVSVVRGGTTLSTALKNDTYLARRLTLSWEPAACACRLCRVTRVIKSLT